MTKQLVKQFANSLAAYVKTSGTSASLSDLATMYNLAHTLSGADSMHDDDLQITYPHIAKCLVSDRAGIADKMYHMLLTHCHDEQHEHLTVLLHDFNTYLATAN